VIAAMAPELFAARPSTLKPVRSASFEKATLAVRSSQETVPRPE
jgi:hypothetical protein